MRLEIDIPEHHYNNIMALDSVSLGRMPYKGIIMYTINAIKHGKVLEQEPATKNDLAQERYQDLIEYFGDEKVAKTILESRREFKTWLERLRWNTKKVDELARELEQLKGTTKNDLVVDAVSRDMVKKYIQDHIHEIITESGEDKNKHTNRILRSMIHGVNCMPSVTPQEPKTGHWIADAKTYYEELNKRGLRVDEYTPYFTDDIACSECLAKYSMLDNETQFFKHCPNCGADMREVEE